jgi:CHAT domain-containing protein/tetratricopeptide (TPR) repeat protein
MLSPLPLAGLVCTIALFTPLTSMPVMAEGAIAQVQTTEQKKAEADRLEALGKQQQKQALYLEARESFQRLVKLRQEMGDRAGEAEASVRLAEVYNAVDQAQEALQLAESGLKLFRSLGNQKGEIDALLMIAYSQPDKQKGLEIADQAVGLARSLKDTSWEGRAIASRGQLLVGMGKLPEALTSLQEGQILLKQTTAVEEEELGAGLLIGYIQVGQGKPDAGIMAIEAAINQARQLGNRKYELDGSFLLAVSYVQTKDFVKALALTEKILPDIMRSGATESEYPLLQIQVGIYAQNKQLDQVIKVADRLLVIAKTPERKIEALQMIGKLQSGQNQHAEALKTYQKIVAIAQDNSSFSLQEAGAWMAIGDIHKKLESDSQSVEPYQKALKIYQANHKRDEEFLVLGQLGYSYNRLGSAAIKKKDYSKGKELLGIGKQYFKDLSDRANQVEDKMWQINGLGGLAATTSQLGHAAYEEADYGQSVILSLKTLEINDRALNLSRKLGKPDLIQSLLFSSINHQNSLATAYLATKEHSKGLKACQAAQDAINELKTIGLGDLDGIISTVINTVKSNTILHYKGQIKELDSHKDSDQVIALHEKIIDLAGNDSDQKIEPLMGIADIYDQKGKYKVALDYYQKALDVSNSLENSSRQKSLVLSGMGMLYRRQGKFDQALESLEKSLKFSNTGERAMNLMLIAGIYADRGNFTEAIAYNQTALQANTLRYNLYSQKTITAETIRSLCNEDLGLSKTAACLHPENPRTGHSLNIWKPLVQAAAQSSAEGISSVTNNLGVIYLEQGDYIKSLEAFLQADKWVQEKGMFRRSVSPQLSNIAQVNFSLGNLAEAEKTADRMIQLAQTEDPFRLAQAYQTLGFINGSIGNNSTALESYKKALKIAEDLDVPSLKASSLTSMGSIYANQGNFIQSLSSLNQSLDIWKQLQIPVQEIHVLVSTGKTYRQLGQFDRALEFQNQALKISQKIGTIPYTASSMMEIATIYREKGKLDLAGKIYQEALGILEKVGDLNYTSQIHLNLAKLQVEQKQPQQALEHLQKGLTLQQKAGAKPLIAQILEVQGQIQTQLNQPQAETNLQNAIALQTNMGNTPGLASSKASLAAYYAKQNQPELAIALYKSAVQNYEAVRKGLATLPKNQQESYTETVAKTYRELARLLLKNDRILEAHQVVELLKIQELDSYSRDTRGQGPSLSFLKAETELLNAFNQQVTAKYISFFQAIQELEALLAKPETEKTAAIQKRIRDLEDLKAEGYNIAKEFLAKRANNDLIKELKQEDNKIELDKTNYKTFDAGILDLKQFGQTAAIYYPLIYDEYIEILLIIPNRPPLRRTVNIDRTTFNNTVADFLLAITDADKNPMPTAQQLYQWLIKPIEADLKEAGINTILYSPDRRLRSIPLMALHDGQQWLIEKYQVSHITALTTTNIARRRNASPKVLSGTISDQFTTTYNVKLPNTPQGLEFNGLPAGKIELNAISQTISGSKNLVDQDFSTDRIRDNASQFNILHLATHGYFDAGNPENSFLLFSKPDSKGKNYATITDISNWHLPNMDLVTLSACQTAVALEKSDEKLGALGISYEFQKAGFPATIASLWRVNDRSTALLMQAFYANLSQGKTKAEALKNAQTTMLRLNTTDTVTQAHDRLNRSLSITPTIPISTTTPKNTGYSHPYYWAPFILIGNSL